MTSIVQLESVVLALLIIISAVALTVNRLRIPYTVALVLVGLLLTFRHDLRVEFTPELILAIFIPPIAFEAAFQIEWRQLRENMVLILAWRWSALLSAL